MELRSLESEIRAFVKFVNCSEREVEVHWVNFAGHCVYYTTLKPGEKTMVREKSLSSATFRFSKKAFLSYVT